MRGESGQSGSITIWMLGLGICLLALGGLGLDLWSAVVIHSRLSGLAEAIATAAGSGISEEHWRRTGQVRLDPDRAERLGLDLASHHPGAALLDAPPTILVNPGHRSVSVQVRGSTRLSLLRLIANSERLEIMVSSTSEPHVVGQATHSPG